MAPIGVPADRPIGIQAAKARTRRLVKPTCITWLALAFMTTASVARPMSARRSVGIVALTLLVATTAAHAEPTATAATTPAKTATAPPQTKTNTQTQTVTQTKTVTAPTQTKTVTAPTQTNTVIQTHTVTTPTQTTSTSSGHPGAAAAAGAAAANTASKSSESSGLPAWAWVLIGAAVVGIIGAILATRRRGKGRSAPGAGQAPGAEEDRPPPPGAGP